MLKKISQIINFKKLIQISKKAKKNNKTIVFTNGIMDLCHIGHIRYLQKAREQGDILIIGLNSDSSTKRLKGKNRPIFPEKQRAEMLFPYVDYIYIFSSLSPLYIVKKIKPDIYVKGGDYITKEEKSGSRNFVKSYGGKVYLAPLIKGISTTKIIEKIWKIK